MGAVFLYVVVLCFALASSEVLLAGAASRSSWSYVISVDHQAAGEQPYPRGCNSKQVSITVGTGKAAVNYAFTADTGSAALLMTCKTPTSTANCGGSLPASSNYELTPAHTVTGSTCSVANTGIGCLLPDQQCFISEALTGDPGYYNINNGQIAQDTVTVQNVLSGGRLSFKGMFGCAEAYINCPGSGNGIEAGWTFNVGGAPSAMAVPEQIYQAGLISKKVTGICYQRPQKDASCTNQLKPNSAVVLGPALPRGVNSTQLHSAPLIPAVFPTPTNGSATPYTNTFRSNVISASVPAFNNPSAPLTCGYDGVSVLWDTGAYGQSTVPADAYDAFVAYWQAGYAAAKASADAKRYGWTIEPCASPSAAMCRMQSTHAFRSPCQAAALPPCSGAQKPWPPCILQASTSHWRVVQWPSCPPPSHSAPAAASRNTATTAVAVCSYVQGASPVGGYFWLAGPWFMGRFVQFDSSAPAAGFPESTGTVYWSDPISSCSFSS
ncbi:hypothetical protein OEZ85_009227 [Tetradesmus obliquus]|uniref:Xylanase inhibitor N-terminal domain-containing protein n=1 Tax=Tetradesmus obliquus TaxID=3088 RepID=A0ABY8U8L4_TETOB|nr:hypothetical protein OEZ85_009227 [Tetradesmus obliquus]